MNHDEIVLINLYISLQMAERKARLFEEKKCEIPTVLELRIKNLRAEIAERERKAA